MKNHPLLTVTSLAIVSILILASIAILKGLNTGIVSAAIATIAGLGGYTIGRLRPSKPKQDK